MNEKVLDKFHFENIVFSLLLLSVVMMTFSSIRRFDAVTSILIALGFILTTVLTVSALLKDMNKYLVLLWLGILIISLLAVFISGEKIDFEYLKFWIMFMSTINLFYWITSVRVTKIMINNLGLCVTVIGIMFVIAYYSGLGYSNPLIPDYLTFGLSNPNLTGIYLLNVFLTLIVSLEVETKKVVKLIRLILACFIVYFIWGTEARACMIGVIFFLLIRTFGIKKYSKGFNFFMVIFPLLFSIIYMKLIDTSIVEFFKFAQSEGKNLDSRVKIWTRVFGIIKEHPFLGDYNEKGNLHNMHLAVIAMYGSFVFAGVVALMNHIINSIGCVMKEKFQYMGLFAFYAIIVSGCFEAAFFTGSQGMYVLSLGLLMMAKYNVNEDEN